MKEPDLFCRRANDVKTPRSKSAAWGDSARSRRLQAEFQAADANSFVQRCVDLRSTQAASPESLRLADVDFESPYCVGVLSVANSAAFAPASARVDSLAADSHEDAAARLQASEDPTPACELELGNDCLNADGNRVAFVEREALPEKVAVFNLEVEGRHTYFVGNDAGALVHNDCAYYYDYACTVGSGFCEGLWTGFKGVTNGLTQAGYSAATLGLGHTDGPFTLTATDLAYGGGISQTLGNISGNLLIAAGTCRFAGVTKFGACNSLRGAALFAVAKAANAYDAVSNAVSVASGISDMVENGVSVSNVAATITGALGLAANVAGVLTKGCCFVAGTQVLVGEKTVTVGAAQAVDSGYSFELTDSTTTLCVVATGLIGASYVAKTMRKRSLAKAQTCLPKEQALRRGNDFVDGGPTPVGAGGSGGFFGRFTGRGSAWGFASVCLFALAIAALCVAFGASDKVKANALLTKSPESVQRRYVTKNIEDVAVGDEVLAYDVKTGETVKSVVSSTSSLKSDHLRVLITEDEKGVRQTIQTTDTHPFWVVTNSPDLSRQADLFSSEHDVVSDSDFVFKRDNLLGNDDGFYVEAKDLQIDDRFIGPHGETSLLVDSLREEHPNGIDVYNFEVANNNNYFVTADKSLLANPAFVLVHNAQCCKVGENLYDIELDVMKGWSPGDLLDAERKVYALTERETIVTHNITRTGAPQRRARTLFNMDKKNDADHIVDLQLGGKDEIENIWELSASVNRSFGSQINNLLKL